MIKVIKKFQIKLTPFDATKTWHLSTINNEDLLLHDTGSYTDPEVPVALEFIDYSSIGDLPRINDECNIALEQQDDDLANTNIGLKKSGLFFPETDPQNEDGTYKRVIYSQVNTMFYNNSRNPTQTWGMNNIDFTLSKTKRRISDEFRLFDVPKNIYGDKIIPNTVTLHDYSSDIDFDITDDGNGNLVAGTNLFSKFQEIGDFTNTFIDGFSLFCDSYWELVYDPERLFNSASFNDSSSFDVSFFAGSMDYPGYGDTSSLSILFYTGSTTNTYSMDSMALNVGYLFGSIDTFTVGDSGFISSSFYTGSINDVFEVVNFSETESMIWSFTSGSAMDVIESAGSFSETGSMIWGFLSGSIGESVVSSSQYDTSSVNVLFYSSSIYTYVIPLDVVSEDMSVDSVFYTGSKTVVLPGSGSATGSGGIIVTEP